MQANATTKSIFFRLTMVFRHGSVTQIGGYMNRQQFEKAAAKWVADNYETQARAARKLGISRQRLNNFFKRGNMPPPELLQAMGYHVEVEQVETYTRMAHAGGG
jgi:hypothetical protein